jgi:hypothetical protein
VVVAAPGTRDRSLTGLRWRWTIAFVLGELVGFVPPALTGVTLAALGVSDAALVAGLVAAGMLEGIAIGVAQAYVLGDVLPLLQRRDWVLATAGGAALAWLAGMGGVALVQASGPGAWAVVGPAMVAGLFAMGILQWRVLRRHLPRSSRWVWVTSGAWLVGVMIPVAALSVVPDGWPPAARVVVAVGAAVAMGATVGLLTGGTLVSLLRRSEQEVDAHGAEA